MPYKYPDKIKLIIFDVNQTMFSLNEIKKRFVKNKLKKVWVDIWFNSILKEGFSYSLSGNFINFKTIGINELKKIFLQNNRSIKRDILIDIMEGFKYLDVHPDILKTLNFLKNENLKVITLTNGSAINTRVLLKKNKLEGLVDHCLSIENFKVWKPHKNVYLKTCKIMEINPKNSLMIAAHGWDINGAKLAGLKTGYISRYEKNISDFYYKPDYFGKDSYDVIRQLKL